ncbi:MAG: HEAT repeat domain-containing protein [Deltaproteobacteria bacterium]|nr:HEAT repeat domain-containing protein [Deltaproteobacteria bacterium]MBW2041903.1 HEAT repeat domain-containing protein [Deltaproteobacteria bacterium]MBW2132811.1 HEAT repeat domain-containing protein [Deltaproteobacteria bacterium]
MKALKARIARLLEKEPFETGLSRILALPPRRAVNPLFSFLYSIREPQRWRAVTAMGAVVAAQAESDMEGARVVMRRLMWNLNDESGGIGWGSAEAMGEICARSPRLAAEFAKILVSYVDPKGNFMENSALQPGVLWGIGRVARMKPDQIRDAAPLLVSFLRHSDPVIRGLAAWAASSLEDPHLIPHLSALSKDPASFTLFLEARPVTIRIRDLARRGTTAGPEETPSIQDTLL